VDRWAGSTSRCEGDMGRQVLSQFWIARRYVCRSCEATAGSLSVVRMAVLSAKVAVRVPGDIIMI
jgi:hypothetical protein